MQKEQRTFTREFKVEAVQLVQSSQKSQAQIARDLGIADSTLHHWCKQFSEQGERLFCLEMPEGFPTLSRRCQACSRNPADFSGPSPGLWESAHPCGAQSAWHGLFTQARGAADAPVGLVGWTET